jgi:CBS domain containing-hemolysin-like protein
MVKSSTPDREAEYYAEEIMDAVEEGEREGVIREDEADMIESIVELPNLEVSEIMTPRMDMICMDVKEPVSALLKTAVEAGHSRIPVYEENRDHIVGVLYVKDLLGYWPDGGKPVPQLVDLLRKPYYIPETKKVSKLFSEFRENKVHMAIVLDEYGGTAGLVTNEDILEEIVGEIVDEFDPEEEAELKILDKRHAEASAKLHIDELNEKMEINLPESEDFDTIGGFIFTSLGKVPTPGDEVHHENVSLKVLDADDRRINRIAVEVEREENGTDNLP